MEWIIRANDGIYFEGKLWVSNIVSNGLYCIDTSDKTAEFIDFFPNERYGQDLLHKRVFLYDKKLFFIPAKARNIHIFSLQKRTFETIPFGIGLKGEVILDAVQIEDKIYIFMADGCCSLMEMNLKTNAITKNEKFSQQLSQYQPQENERLFARCEVSDSKIYFGIYGTDIIASWDVVNLYLEKYHTGINNILNILLYDGKCYFTKNRGKDIFLFDFTKGVIAEAINDDGVELPNLVYYGRLVEFRGHVLALPAYSDDVLIKNDGCFEVLTTAQNGEGQFTYKYFRAVLCGEELWILPLCTDEFCICDENLKPEMKILSISECDCRRITSRYIKEKVINNEILNEDLQFELRDFIDTI